MELKPTTKVAEILAIAQRAAQTAGNPENTPAHLPLPAGAPRPHRGPGAPPQGAGRGRIRPGFAARNSTG